MDLTELTDNKINRTQKNEIGQYLVEEILSNIGQGKSPVKGESWKSKLSPTYKKYKANFSSDLTANMELHGNMLDKLTYKVKGDIVEVGIFNYKQAQKADNHNKFSSASQGTNVPKRRFIPEEGQTFKKDIIKEVERILEE